MMFRIFSPLLLKTLQAGAVLLLCTSVQAAEDRDPAGAPRAPQRMEAPPSTRQVPPASMPHLPQEGLRKAGEEPAPDAGANSSAPRLATCLAPGQVFTLASAKITGPDAGLRPIALSDGGKVHLLEELSRQSGRATLRLPPSSGVEGGRIYDVVLLKESHTAAPASSQGARLLARAEICPAGKAVFEGAPGMAEIVLAVPLAREGAVRQLLLDEGYVIRESAQLLSLSQAMFRIGPRQGMTLPAAMEALRRLLPEAIVDINHLYRLSGAPRLYAPSMIGWSPACASLASGMPVGMIDDGVDAEHSALDGAELSLANFSDGAFAGTDHGTGIAVLFSGRAAPETGYGGLMPGAPLYAADIIDGPPGGESGTAYGFLRALDWLMARQVRFINLSLTGPPNRLLEETLTNAAARGTLFFAAAGNEGKDAPPAYPAAYEMVIAVTAVDAAADLYEKANRGAYVEFAAPGVDIWLAKAGGGGSYRSGTSYAAPFVLAASASLAAAHGGSLTLEKLRSALGAQAKDPGTPGREPAAGHGLLHVECGARNAVR